LKGTVAELFLDTVEAVRPLIASPLVAAQWEEPSALPQFSVGGLAGHLVRAVFTADSYLARPEPVDAEPISTAAYYAALDPDVSSPAHAAIRQRGEDMASGGHGALIASLDALTERLQVRLTEEPDERLVTVAGNVAMRLGDYLATRIVELTVHADDLAASVGTDTPALPDAALQIAVDTLVSVARYRHGDHAVLLALSRRERDTFNALRVF
jgi:uncharacterized protein (TIGR03083 family)